MAERSASYSNPVTRRDALQNPSARQPYQEAYSVELHDRVLGVFDKVIKAGEFPEEGRKSAEGLFVGGVETPDPVTINNQVFTSLAEGGLLRPVVYIPQGETAPKKISSDQVLEYALELPANKYVTPTGEGMKLNLVKLNSNWTMVQNRVRFNT